MQLQINPYRGLKAAATTSYGISQLVTADDVYGVMSGDNESDVLAVLDIVAQQGEAGALENGYMDAVISGLNGNRGEDVKIAVCNAVRGAGPEGHPYQQSIAHLLQDPSLDVEFHACVTLASMGTAAKGVAPLIFPLLESLSANLRCAACAALGSIGADTTVEALTERLQDKSPEVQGAACIALGNLGICSAATAVDVAKYLDKPRCKVQALTALGAMTADLTDGIIEDICKCLKDEDAEARAAAVVAIGKKGGVVSACTVAFNMVVDLLEHEDGRFRSSAAIALGSMGLAASSEASKLKALLKDDFAESAANALTVGGVRARAPPAFRKPRCAAAIALGSMGTAGCQYAGDMARLLQEDDWEVRLCACEGLGLLGEEAQSCVDNVTKLLRDDIYVVRARAAAALGKMRDPACAQALADVIADNSPAVREEVLLAISNMGQDAEEHASKVFEQLSDHYPNVRAAACKCLGNLGQKGQFYAGHVAQRLVEEDVVAVKLAALEALGQMGPRGGSYAEEVCTCIQDTNPDVRAQAAAALGRMGEDAAPFMQDLKFLCNDPYEEVRESARTACGTILMPSVGDDE